MHKRGAISFVLVVAVLASLSSVALATPRGDCAADNCWDAYVACCAPSEPTQETCSAECWAASDVCVRQHCDNLDKPDAAGIPSWVWIVAGLLVVGVLVFIVIVFIVYYFLKRKTEANGKKKRGSK